MRIEAFVVPKFSRVQNEDLEITCKRDPHLAQICLSDICIGSEQLEIDVLIGADLADQRIGSYKNISKLVFGI